MSSIYTISSSLVQEIIPTIKKDIEPNSINGLLTLSDGLGFDSLDIVELTMALGDKLGVILNYNKFDEVIVSNLSIEGYVSHFIKNISRINNQELSAALGLFTNDSDPLTSSIVDLTNSLNSTNKALLQGYRNTRYAKEVIDHHAKTKFKMKDPIGKLLKYVSISELHDLIPYDNYTMQDLIRVLGSANTIQQLRINMARYTWSQSKFIRTDNQR